MGSRAAARAGSPWRRDLATARGRFRRAARSHLAPDRRRRAGARARRGAGVPRLAAVLRRAGAALRSQGRLRVGSSAAGRFGIDRPPAADGPRAPRRARAPEPRGALGAPRRPGDVRRTHGTSPAPALDRDRAPAAGQQPRRRAALDRRGSARARSAVSAERALGRRADRCCGRIRLGGGATRAGWPRLQPLGRSGVRVVPDLRRPVLRADLGGARRHPCAAPHQWPAPARSPRLADLGRARGATARGFGARHHAPGPRADRARRVERADAPADRDHGAAFGRGCGDRDAVRAHAARDRALARAGGPMSAAANYLALTKPRLLPLVLFSALPALVMAAGQLPPFAVVAAILVGTSLTAGAANAL